MENELLKISKWHEEEDLLACMRQLGFDELFNPLLEQKRQTCNSRFSQIVSTLNLSNTKGHKRIYAICMARRMFNLLAGWERLLKKMGEKTKFLPNVEIVSENGIMFYANDIADYYATYAEFPRIIIYDDLTITGDKLVLCVMALAEAICARLKELGANPGQETIINQLMKDITILVLGKSIIQEDIPLEAQSCIIAYDSFDTEKRHEVSEELTKIIDKMEVANTVYTVSAIKNSGGFLGNFKESQNWCRIESSFDNFSANEYFFQVEDESLKKSLSFFAVVREYSRNGKVFYSPFVLHPECETDRFQNFCSYLSRVLMKKELNRISDQLNELAQALNDPEKSFLALYTFQFVEMLMGQMLLSVFIQDFGLNNIPLEYDTDKTTRNFGKRLLKSDWLDLVEMQWTKDELQDVFTQLSKQWPDEKSVALTSVTDSSDDINIQAANGIYRFAIQTKQEQLNLKTRRNTSNVYHIQMSEYCRNMRHETTVFSSELTRYYQSLAERNDQKVMKLISAATLMSDLGYMSFCVRKISNRIGLAYRHSEMTMLLYPILLGDKWNEVKKMFLPYGTSRSNLFGFKDVAWFMSLGKGMDQYGTLLDNMASALEDGRLFWSVLKWNR